MNIKKFKQRILFEDNHLIIVNKESSEIVQGDKTGDITMIDTVKAYIKEVYHKPGDVFLGTVHRLDRPVSGAVIFARTSKALSRMNELIKNRDIQKTYWAVVKNRPEKLDDTLVHYLIKDEKKNKSAAHHKEKKGSKRAELSYHYLDSSKDYHLLEVQLKTGRHHQIRVQLAKIGSQIKGDLKYGSPRSNKDGSIHLHARRLEFIHPVSKEKLCIIAPPPNEPLWQFFAVDKD